MVAAGAPGEAEAQAHIEAEMAKVQPPCPPPVFPRDPTVFFLGATQY